MLLRSPHNPTGYDDDWEDQPAQGTFYKWVLGVAIPITFIVFAGRALFNGEVAFGERSGLTLHGVNAVAYGWASISAAVFVHCHYFWGNVYNQAWVAVLGKIISACGFIAGLGVILWRFGVLDIR